MTRIKYQGGYYAVGRLLSCGVWAEAKPGMTKHEMVFGEEESARRWLGDHGLPRSKARQLIAAELRNEGPFADPKHPRRVTL